MDDNKIKTKVLNDKTLVCDTSIVDQDMKTMIAHEAAKTNNVQAEVGRI